MRTIAVLITCYNRKEKTIACLKSLFNALRYSQTPIDLKVYLTDDGSEDGTSEFVHRHYPNIHIIKGDGSLYWAGGMRMAWEEAEKWEYDFYLLLNDDTILKQNAFNDLLDTHAYCVKKYNIPGVYIGSTIDEDSETVTYGGASFTNKFLATYKRIKPSGIPQKCDLGNANIMMVPNFVTKKIGILSEGYKHGLADFDYTLRANKKHIPVLIAPDIIGICNKNPKGKYIKLLNQSFSNRRKALYSPLGFDFNSNLNYMKRHFPYRLPIVFVAGWLKVLFPKFFIHALKHTR